MAVVRVPMINGSALAEAEGLACSSGDHLSTDGAARCLPELWPAFTDFVLRLLVPGALPEYIDVRRYGDVGVASENDSDSIIGRLLSGDADLSPPFMNQQPARMQRLNFIGPLLKAKLFVAYSRGLLDSKEALDLGHLYPNFVLVPLLVAVLSFTFCGGTRKLWRRLIPEPFARRFHRRLALVFAFFYGVFIGVFKTHLVVFFNLPSQTEATVRSKAELLLALETGTVTAVTNTPVYLNTLLRPESYAGESEVAARFLAAAARNPPLLSDDRPELLAEIFDPAKRRPGRKLVLVSDSYYLAFLKPAFCDIEYYYFLDDPPMSLGMYQNRQSKVRVRRPTSVESRVIEAEYQRLLSSHAKKDCHRHQGPAHQRAPFTIALEQLTGVGLSVAASFGVAAGLLLCEVPAHLVARALRPVARKASAGVRGFATRSLHGLVGA